MTQNKIPNKKNIIEEKNKNKNNIKNIKEDLIDVIIYNYIYFYGITLQGGMHSRTNFYLYASMDPLANIHIHPYTYKQTFRQSISRDKIKMIFFSQFFFVVGFIFVEDCRTSCLLHRWY